MPRRTVGNPVFTTVTFGLIGGLVGGIAMGLVGYLVPAPFGGDILFMAASGIAASSADAIFLGWLLHMVIGMALGAGFGVVVTSFSGIRTTRATSKMVLGVLVGMVAWVLVFLPVLTLMPSVISSGSYGSLLANVLFGVVLVAVFGVGQSLYLIEPEKKGYPCGVCGKEFLNKHERNVHYKEEHLKVREKVNQ